MKGERGSKVDWSIDKIENARSLPLLMNERLVNIVTAGGSVRGTTKRQGVRRGTRRRGTARDEWGGEGTSVRVYVCMCVYAHVRRSLTLCNVGT